MQLYALCPERKENQNRHRYAIIHYIHFRLLVFFAAGSTIPIRVCTIMLVAEANHK